MLNWFRFNVLCIQFFYIFFLLQIFISVMTAKIDIADTKNESNKIKIYNACEQKSKPSTIIGKIVHFLDLKLLTDAIYVNIVFGLTFALFSDSMFSTLLPIYMMDKGFTKVNTNHFFEYSYLWFDWEFFVFKIYLVRGCCNHRGRAWSWYGRSAFVSIY